MNQPQPQAEPQAPATPAHALLEVRDLHAAYQGVIRVLHGVNLRVPANACVALLGANGAGKSTLLKAISGMLAGDGGAVTGGEVRLDDAPVTGKPSHWMVRQGLIHVLEGRFVFPDLTVRDNLKMGAFTRRDRAAIADDIEHVLHDFPRLRERIDVQAGYLSGGEQQMLAIGRAVMARPRVLLLDEPSMGLSPLLVQEVFDIIRKIRASRSLTVLVVEQNVRKALNLADYGYILETGRIVLQGTTAELKANPQLHDVYFGGSGH